MEFIGHKKMFDICEENKITEIYSFDVFDTVITRSVGSPEGVFFVMQEKLRGIEKYKSICNQFPYIRKTSEQAARDFARCLYKQEVSITDIYENVKEMAGLCDSEINELIEIEFNTEIECIVPIGTNISAIKELIEENKKVILISDIYWDNARLHSILDKIDKVFEKIRIYSSSTFCLTKKHGGLYLHVKEREQIQDTNKWTHIGDNYQSDVLMPKLLGVNSFLYKPSCIPEWMISIANQCADNRLHNELQIGVLNILRNQISQNDYVGLGIGFSGIIIYQFADYIISVSEKKNVQCVYFLARDGYVIKKAVDTIIKARGVTLKTKYLYISSAVCRKDRYDKTGQTDWEDNVYRLYEYIKQNVNFSEKCAFVDSQGSGISMQTIASITEANRTQDIVAIYYALIRDRNIKGCDFNFFRFERSDFIEILCRAPHGRIIGYESGDNGCMDPIMDAEPFEEELFEYENGIMMYIGTIEAIIKRTGLSMSGRMMGENYIHYINRQPNLKHILSTLKKKDGLAFKVSRVKNEDKINVIVYGAGNIGKEFVYNAEKSKNINVIGWTDIDYARLHDQEYPVINLDEALKLPYDNVVIAIFDGTMRRAVVDVLTSKGVDDTIIIPWYEVSM